MSITCRTVGRTIFPSCRGDIGCSNEQMYYLQYAVNEIATYYKQLTAVDLRGTLQEKSGQVPGPFPNKNYYSPEELMNDCIHPNSAGFDAIFDRFWDVYFKKEVEGVYGPPKRQA